MGDTQSFRLIGTTEIQKIPVQHIGGQNVVNWESIEEAFPGARQVKNNDVAIPRFIKYFPNKVLDIVLSCATDHLHIDSPVRAPSVFPTVASAAALITLPNALFRLPVEPESENKFVKDLRVASASTQTPISEMRAHNLSTDYSILSSSSHSKFKATSKTAPSLKQVVQLASDGAKDYGPQVQIQELSANMAHMIKLQNALDAKQEKMNQLQNQVLEQQEKMNQLQKYALEGQKKIKQLQKKLFHHQQMMNQLQIKDQEELRHMHNKVVGQLAVLQSRVHAVLTQTFELHEYPIPRLFIVLPQDPSGWDAVNPFSNKFRLYFICECGEHTKLANSKTKIPHHIHLAKHEGYEIARPSEFFQQYGSYLLTILKMLKLGITVTGVAIPALSQLISPEVIGQSINSLKQLQKSIMPTVDQVIEWIDSMDESEAIEDISTSKGNPIEKAAKQMETKEALEGADLRKLSTFLHDADGDKVLGNLYRTVTVEGHVKWVCIDHYRENYQEAQAEAFRRALDSVGGSFDENAGSVTVKLQSRVLAEQFYAVLRKARYVLELNINLDFECARSDLEGLESALKTSSVSIFRLDHQRFRTSIGSRLSSKSAQHEILFRIMELPNMKVVHIILSKEFGKLSDFQPKNTYHLHKLSLEMVVGRVKNKEVRILVEMLQTNSTLITWYLYHNSTGDSEAQDPSEAFKTNSTLTFLDLSNNSIGDNGVQALSEVLKNNSTLIALNLRDNSIGDNGALALSESLKNNSTLTSLNLESNKIGDSGVQALSEVLKISSTLTTLSLMKNSIGFIGAQALSEALKRNSTLIALNLWSNSIGDNGAQALSGALKANSTLAALSLGKNKITDNGAQALSEALKNNSSLTKLVLGYNSIGDNGAQALSEALKSKSSLKALDLWRNKIGYNGARALSEALGSNSTLTTLNLQDNSIGENGARSLSVALKNNSTLTSLKLESNSIGDNGVQALSEALMTNSTLTTLGLEEHSIRANAAQALSEALKINSTLTTLVLVFYDFGDNGAEVLSEALKTNSTLNTLILCYNSIGDNGAQALSEVLKNNSRLKTLDLRNNSIGNNGAQALSKALKTNSTLISLDLRDNSIGENGAQALSEVLKSNKTLTSLRY